MNKWQFLMTCTEVIDLEKPFSEELADWNKPGWRFPILCHFCLACHDLFIFFTQIEKSLYHILPYYTILYHIVPYYTQIEKSLYHIYTILYHIIPYYTQIEKLLFGLMDQFWRLP